MTTTKKVLIAITVIIGGIILNFTSHNLGDLGNKLMHIIGSILLILGIIFLFISNSGDNKKTKEGWFYEKSLILAALSLSLLSSALLPSISAYAKEPEFNYSVSENNLTGVKTIEMNYNGDELTAYYDTNTCEVTMNDEIVATVSKTKTGYTDNAEPVQ